ncbi:MAG: S-adenosylmethionine:tRNA ribosyltransferase-isomerase, partial [Bacteroidia bacterium]|nr:S-adenosylmethionine:tRNA ribosyltransferase-isomerase [Bacteroidia bacterium]
LKAIIAHKNEVVCVGTTSLRTLESIYWISYLMIDKNLQPENGFYYLSQWTAYSLQKEHNIPFKLSCQKLLHFMQEKKYLTIKIKTQILIAPGYRINSVQKLITNFHQPGSTLMLLVACLTGKENWKKIYQHALENNYRFLSYGDSSLLSITPSLQEI